MSKKNRRPTSRAYLNDFHPTADGSYVYTGTNLHWEASGIPRKQALAVFSLLGLIQAAAVIVCGCIPAPGMLDCFWVIIPYVASLTAVFLLIWALIRLILAGDPIREYIHRSTVQRFPVLTGACMVTCMLTALAEALYLLTHGGSGQGAFAAVFLLSQAVGCCSAFLWKKLCRRLRWQAV